MDSVFITGATGFIGKQLALTLANAGYSVKALVRKTSITDGLHHPGLQLVTGNITDKKSLLDGMKGCKQVYHLAGLAKMWVKDKSQYEKINVQGTRNLLDAAGESGVDKIIVTSTAGVFPPVKKEWVDETAPKRRELHTEYEKTKNEAEELTHSYARKGFPVVIVNPTNVYGPGVIDDSNTATMMMRDYILGKWRILPAGGTGIMNYVYIDDMVDGLMAAMEKAAPGSQYILGGDNGSYNDFFELIRNISGTTNKLFSVPYGLIRVIAREEDIRSKLFGTKPLITTEWVKKLPYNWSKDISKAKRELGYHPLSLEEGIRKTCRWLKETKQI